MSVRTCKCRRQKSACWADPCSHVRHMLDELDGQELEAWFDGSGGWFTRTERTFTCGFGPKAKS